MKKGMLVTLFALLLLPMLALAEDYGWTNGEYHLENTGLFLRLPEDFTPTQPEEDEILSAKKGELTDASWHVLSVSIVTTDDIDALLAERYDAAKQMLIEGIGEENVYEDTRALLRGLKNAAAVGLVTSDTLEVSLDDRIEFKENFYYRPIYISKKIPYVCAKTTVMGATPFYMIEAYVDSSEPKLGPLMRQFIELPAQEASNQYYLVYYAFSMDDEESDSFLNTDDRRGSLASMALARFFAFESEELIQTALEENRAFFDADVEEQRQRYAE